MKPIFAKELYKYRIIDLHKMFNCETEKLGSVINDLTFKGVLRKERDFYKFIYVGFIYYNDGFIFVMPKFIKQCNYEFYYPIIIQLFKDYNQRENLSTEEIETFGSFETEEQFNILKITHFLLSDFNDNGLYHNDMIELELNGEGEIDWNNTIERNQSYVTGQNIIYLDFYTKNLNSSNEDDYIKKIHMFVLNKSSDLLRKLGILNILGLPDVNFNVEINELGEVDYILYRLELEKSNQYIDRKLILLDALYFFIETQNTFEGDNKPYLFGTKHFEIVWERVCSFVFNNDYKQLRHIIPHPIWKDYKTLSETKKETLIPDILKLLNDYELFFIIDAKYYTTTFNENGKLVNNAPGIGDISKQLLYEKVFYKFLNIAHYSFYNVFLMPTDGKDELFGETSFELFERLGPIYLLRINANRIFTMYSNKEQKKDVYYQQLSTKLKQ